MLRSEDTDKDMKEDGYITPREAADIAGKHVTTILGWARKRLVPSKRVGPGRISQVFIHEESLRKLIKPVTTRSVKSA